MYQRAGPRRGGPCSSAAMCKLSVTGAGSLSADLQERRWRVPTALRRDVARGCRKRSQFHLASLSVQGKCACPCCHPQVQVLRLGMAGACYGTPDARGSPERPGFSDWTDVGACSTSSGEEARAWVQSECTSGEEPGCSRRRRGQRRTRQDQANQIADFA